MPTPDPSGKYAGLFHKLFHGPYSVLLDALVLLLLGLQVDDECFFHLAGPPVTRGK